MIAGRVALITGGSRGIGAAIATGLAEAGADVAFTYRGSVNPAEEVCRLVNAWGRRALAIQADSTDVTALTSAVNHTHLEFGRLDILVNSAGIFPYGPVEEVTVEQIDESLHVYPRAAYIASQAALRHMTRGGRIISIGSCIAERVPTSGLTLYAMSKSALVGFTKGLARDVGARGITVNLVQPGSTNTDMNPEDGPAADGERAYTALGRYADPKEIAAAVTYLAGPGGSYVTGACIAVDGGYAA